MKQQDTVRAYAANNKVSFLIDKKFKWVVEKHTVNNNRHSFVLCYNGRNYILSRFLWELEHGAIPHKHVIHHIDKNWKNNRLDNLEPLTVSEHRLRHNGDKRKKPDFRHVALTNDNAARVARQEHEHYIHALSCPLCKSAHVA